MRNILIIFLLMILLPNMAAGARTAIIADTSRYAPLGAKLAEYYEAMVREPLYVQAQECDFLILTAADSLVRQFVAQDIYRHYIQSPLMGAENVAVHVFDKWFGTGQILMQDSEEFRQAQVYADFNRQSLIGKRAPQLELTAVDGSIITLFSGGSSTADSAMSTEGSHSVDRSFSAGTSSSRTGHPSGNVNPGAQKFSVLYFYDTDCAKCKLETVFLNTLLSSKSYPIDFYAVYVGDDQQEWQSYYADNLTGAVHLWDPEMHSDFQKKYGVTQTPRMFLIGLDGEILGRGLDTQALGVMLDDVFAQKNLVYGSRDSEVLFDGIFAMYDGKPGVAQVMGIADYISDKTLSVRDTVSFRQLSGDYLYYLSTHSGEGFKEGLGYHIDKNIFSQPAVWKSQDDSLKVIGFAQIMSDLLSKAVPGTKVTGLKVPGELLTSRGVKKTVKKLNKLPAKENVIIFYTSGCEVCSAEKAAAAALVSQSQSRVRGAKKGSQVKDSDADKGSSICVRGAKKGSEGTPSATVSVSDIGVSGDVKVFMVNVDDIMASDPALASRLMDSFDISSLPYIIITDSKGTVLRRYVSLL